MSKLVSEQEMIDYLLGKSIAVVGSARAIRERGEEIDSHDVVIRFNNFVTKGYEKLVGTKTHIWASVGGPDICSKVGIPHVYHWYPHGARLAENGKYKLRDCHIYVDERGLIHYGANQKILSDQPLFLNVDLHRLSSEYWECAPDLKIWRAISDPSPPSSGLRILTWLYNRGFRFNHYGFDGLRTAHYYDYTNDQRQRSLVVIENPVHDQQAEIKYLEIINNNKRVEAIVTKYLQPLFTKWGANKFDAIHTDLDKASSNSIVAILHSFPSNEVIRLMIKAARSGRIIKSKSGTTFAPKSLL